LEHQRKSDELRAATLTSRVNELTALQQTAEHEIQQLRQRNDRITDQLSQLQRQVRTGYC